MSSFLDRLEKIKVGVQAPLGFGAPRAQKMPGMALVGLVSQDYAKGIEVLADLKPDAVLVSGVDDPAALKGFAQSLDPVAVADLIETRLLRVPRFRQRLVRPSHPAQRRARR